MIVRALLTLVVLAVALFAALFGGAARADEPVRSQDGFRCDGTDPLFFEEMKKAGTLGYGETWDETICDEGLAIYGEGATSRWSAFKQKRPYRASGEKQMLALVMPMIAVGGVAAVLLGASALAFASRLKKRVILDVACPACDAELPVAADDKSGHQLFCPVCGAGCAIDVQGKGKHATARARLLTA